MYRIENCVPLANVAILATDVTAIKSAIITRLFASAENGTIKMHVCFHLDTVGRQSMIDVDRGIAH